LPIIYETRSPLTVTVTVTVTVTELCDLYGVARKTGYK